MNPVVKYFSGEKAESYLFLGLGILGLGITLYAAFFLKTPFWKGFAIPVLLVSILELVVGITLIFRSPKDIARVEHSIKNEPHNISTAEIPRMKQVMQNFVIFRYTEIALVIVGAVLYWALGQYPFWKGLGIGLAMQASIVLVLDYFAERRGFVYLDYLNSLGNG